MVYKVIKALEYQGKSFLPGDLIKIDPKDFDLLKDKIVRVKKLTKVID